MAWGGALLALPWVVSLQIYPPGLVWVCVAGNAQVLCSPGLLCLPCPVGRVGGRAGDEVRVTLLAGRRSGLCVPLMRCWAQPLNTDLAPAAGGRQPDLPGDWGPAAHTSHIGGTCPVHGHPACTPTLLGSLSDSLEHPSLAETRVGVACSAAPSPDTTCPWGAAQEVPATGASIS